jgi:hypothetical protein
MDTYEIIPFAHQLHFQEAIVVLIVCRVVTTMMIAIDVVAETVQDQNLAVALIQNLAFVEIESTQLPANGKQ